MAGQNTAIEIDPAADLALVQSALVDGDERRVLRAILQSLASAAVAGLLVYLHEIHRDAIDPEDQ